VSELKTNNEPIVDRDYARQLFTDSGVAFADLRKRDIQSLRNKINSKMVSSQCFRGRFRCHQRPQYFDGGCSIRCRSYYFTQREAVTFNDNGFIGFAGWASNDNVKPIIEGFVEWLNDLIGEESKVAK